MSDCTAYIQKRKVYHELGSVSADFNIWAWVTARRFLEPDV